MQTIRRKFILGVFGFVCMLASSGADADWWSDAARSAVRSEIRSHSDWTRVVFTRAPSTHALSSSIVSVTGEGLASDRPGWGGMPFRYTLALRRSDRHFSRIHIRYADGQEHRGSETWNALPADDVPDVHITSPRWYQITHSHRVSVKGDAAPREDVTVTLYARDGRQVIRRSVRSSARGGWSMTVTLAPGNYRVTAVSGASEDELRFAVRRQTGSWSNEDTQTWGWDRWLRTNRGAGDLSGLRIDAPRSGALIKGPQVWLRGRANDATVTVSLEHGDLQVLQNRSVPVRRGRWTIRVMLKPGTHRLIVQAGDRGAESKFTVR